MDSLKPYTYLLINLFSIAGPLIFSFTQKDYYARYWKYVLPGLFITATGFILWDALFTGRNIWWFNKEYVTGINILNLPLEECMFFLCIPFSCMFIYLIIRKKYTVYFFPQANYIWIFISVLLLVLGFYNIEKLYTSVTFIATALVLLFYLFVLRVKWFGIFTIAYLWHLVPFFIVNGILTAIPVVLYNESHNLGIRLITIPVEDTVYSCLLLLLNTALFEFFFWRWSGDTTMSELTYVKKMTIYKQ